MQLRVWWHYLLACAKFNVNSDRVVSHRRECGHTSYRAQLNMETREKEQQRVIQFLAVKGIGGRKIHQQMKVVYDEWSLCRSSVVEWGNVDSLRGAGYWKTMIDLDRRIESSHRK
ncbi:hypothetical protein TNCV_4048911 [Trichonephila clavipes]|nr:hypothetical protein TNCV_4048911 [Trichonephila clavipes]